MEITAEVSKWVGWKARKVNWPTIEEIQIASAEQLLEWHRFLPGAQSKKQVRIIAEVEFRMRTSKGRCPSCGRY